WTSSVSMMKEGPMNDTQDSILETPAEKLGASRRLFLSLAGAGTGAAALSACAAGGGGGGDEGGGSGVSGGEGEVTDENPLGDAGVDVVIFNGGYGDQYAKEAGEKYEEMYPDADVKVSSTVNIQPDLQPRFIGGNPPDLFDNSGAQSMNAGALVGEGSVAEIDQLLEAPSLDGGTLKDLLIPGSMAPGTYSGKVYALNYVYTVYAVWYSQKEFEEKGWTPPTTWDDVMTIGEAAKSEDLALFPWGGQNASNYYQELAISMAIKEAGVDLQKRLDSLEEGVFEDDAL